MQIDKKFSAIMDRAQSGLKLTKEEIIYLLALPESSLECYVLRGVADTLSRDRFGHVGLVFGQIGFEIAPCPGKCQFCSFSEEFTSFGKSSMSDEEILAAAENFTASGELFALSLMTMHEYDFKRVLHVVDLVRNHIPKETQIIVNIGDFDYAKATELKAAGANAAYHLARLGEGIRTSLPIEQRYRTMESIRKAGLDLYYCCEPIGPENTPEEMAEQLLIGPEIGCFQHGAMRRVCLPSSPLAKYGQVSELRLSQVCAVVTLACMTCPETKTLGIHEPNLLGLTAGANAIYAETGANPRDTEKETSGHRGIDIADCKRMLFEAGFKKHLCHWGLEKEL